MQEVTMFCTNVLETNTAFGVREDTGEQVFVSGAVASATKLKIGDRVSALIVPNRTHPEKTPWFAVRIGQPDAGAAGPDRAAQVMAHLESVEMYATTQEVADELGVALETASGVLNRMFDRGQIARAAVHAKPDQPRATLNLWAKDVNRFTGATED